MAETKKRVLMLLSNPYRPDSRVYNEALTLAGNGYSITIIAWDRDGNWPEKETKDGIDIIRVGPRAEGKKHFIRNIRRFWKNAELAAGQLQFDSVHAHDFDTLPPGWLAARLLRRRVVFDGHEPYGEAFARSLPAAVASILLWLERCLVPKVDCLVSPSEGSAVYYNCVRVGARDDDRCSGSNSKLARLHRQC